jgi:MarC family membrane protein
MNIDTVYESFFIAVLVALNPVGNVPFFLGFTAGKTAQQRRRMANVIFIAVTTAVLATILFGQKILAVFGVSTGAFRIGSGCLLLILGLNMVKKGAEAPQIKPGEEDKHDYAIVPISIPIIAGPATLGAIISFTENLDGFMDEVIFCSLGLIASITVWLCLISATKVSRFLGIKGIDAMTRFVGLILIGMAVQGMANGIKTFSSVL